MARQKSVNRRHNRKLNRNIKGLLSKCYKYGKLHGVELALYIDYPEKGEFVSYESDGYDCHRVVEEKKALQKAKNYSTAEVEEKLGFAQTGGASKKVDLHHEKSKKASLTTALNTDVSRKFNFRAFPKLPEFDLSLQQKNRNR